MREVLGAPRGVRLSLFWLLGAFWGAILWASRIQRGAQNHPFEHYSNINLCQKEVLEGVQKRAPNLSRKWSLEWLRNAGF